MQTNTSESLPRTIPELLENHTIQVQPQGYSMYPLFVPGRDSAVIEKADCDRLKKGDVILYRRENGILVLHRICRITKDGFYTVGDNQTVADIQIFIFSVGKCRNCTCEDIRGQCNTDCHIRVHA